VEYPQDLICEDNFVCEAAALGEGGKLGQISCHMLHARKLSQPTVPKMMAAK
jgi:hypothetical protein